MSIDPLDTPTREKADADLRERLRITKRQEAEDFKWLMADPRGRRVVWRYLGLAGVFRSSFTGNSETFFREGERNIGLKLMADIDTHAPTKYEAMVKEAKDDNTKSSVE